MIVAEPARGPERQRDARESGVKARAVAARVAAGTVAVIVAATLTLGAVVTVVTGTTAAISIASLPWRILAIVADVIGGTVLLVACIYLTTRLAVHMVGVGKTEFPPIPDQPRDVVPRN